MAELVLFAGVDTAHGRPIEVVVFQILAPKITTRMCFNIIGDRLGGGTQDKKMSKGRLPRVVYHQVYNVY